MIPEVAGGVGELTLGELGTSEGDEAEEWSRDGLSCRGVCGALVSREVLGPSLALGLQISSEGGEPTCGVQSVLQLYIIKHISKRPSSFAAPHVLGSRLY